MATEWQKPVRKGPVTGRSAVGGAKPFIWKSRWLLSCWHGTDVIAN